MFFISIILKRIKKKKKYIYIKPNGYHRLTNWLNNRIMDFTFRLKRNLYNSSSLTHFSFVQFSIYFCSKQFSWTETVSASTVKYNPGFSRWELSQGRGNFYSVARAKLATKPDHVDAKKKNFFFLFWIYFIFIFFRQNKYSFGKIYKNIFFIQQMNNPFMQMVFD